MSPAGLGTLIRELPASARARLIIIDDAQRLNAACLALLERHAASLATSCVILLVDEPLSAKHPLMALKAHATVERFEKPFDAEASESGKGAFGLVEAIGRRDAAAALQVIHEQVAAGKEVVELMGLLVWQLQRWLAVSRLVDAGVARDRIGLIAGLKPWQVSRVLAELKGRSTASLKAALDRCLELDTAVKTGRVPPRTALEGWVVELTLGGAEAVEPQHQAGFHA